MRISNIAERQFYEIEIARNNWSFREFERQFDSSLYERLALSKDKDKVLALSQKGQIIEHPRDIINLNKKYAKQRISFIQNAERRYYD